MRKTLVIAAFALILATAGQAQQMKVGGHSAFLVGGDLQGDTLGLGAQVSTDVNEVLSLELAGTKFNDDNGPLNIDFLTIAFSARLGATPGENVYLYGGGGANYNIPDIKAPGMDGADVNDAFGFHYCGGIGLAISERGQLYAEYRASSVNFTDPANEELAALFDETYQFALVMVGLNILF